MRQRHRDGTDLPTLVAALRVGGATNHRAGLYDTVLIKDNHLSHVPLKELAAFLSPIVARSRATHFAGSQ